MATNNTPNTTGAVSGNTGARLFSQSHSDIDSSTIDVSCDSGSAEVILDERIWYEWVRRNSWMVGAGDPLNVTVDVDSDWYDGDQRLTVFARSNGTKCRIAFNSVDW